FFFSFFFFKGHRTFSVWDRNPFPSSCTQPRPQRFHPRGDACFPVKASSHPALRERVSTLTQSKATDTARRPPAAFLHNALQRKVFANACTMCNYYEQCCPFSFLVSASPLPERAFELAAWCSARTVSVRRG
ncbi:unnamed protein product, partial [Ixodes pacificus]